MRRQIISLLCILTVAAALLCGCNRDAKPDPKIAELETRVTKMEADLALLTIRFYAQTNLVADDSRFINAIYAVQTNLTNLTKQADYSTRDISGLSNRVANLETLAADVQTFQLAARRLSDRVANLETLAASQTTRPAPPSVQSYAPGQMPASVAAQIRADAAAQFPNDYDEQVFIIKQQTDAWHKLHQ